MSFLRTPAESPLYAGPAETLGYVSDPVHDPLADTVAR